MTVEVILNPMKYLRIHKATIHINNYQNRFINECVRTNFLKYPERQTDRRKDGVISRSSYVLNSINNVEPR